jgi:hypothetical protein
MTIVLSLAIIAGILNCFKTISDTRLGYSPGVKPSKSLIDFTFLNE